MSNVGYKKPPKNRQFGQPGGNPQGATSEQRKMEIANAERATRIQARLLEALEGVMLEDPTKEKITGEFIRNEVLKLIKDAQDRGLGTPTSSVDHTSSDGTMTPKPVTINMTPEQAAEAYASAINPEGE